jgi:hypothetical protein
LLDLFRDTEGEDQDRKLGKLINRQKQAIEGYNAEILELGESFQAFVSSHGPEMEKQFNALIQSFSNQDSQRGMNAFNRQLAEMEEGLGGIVSGDFIRSMIQQKIRTDNDKWSAEQQRRRDREDNQRRQKRQREQEAERRKDDQNFNSMLNREEQIEARFQQSARQRIEDEQQWEKETRTKGLQALEDLQKDQQQREQEAAVNRREQIMDWVDGLDEVVHAFGRIAEMTGADSVLMEQLRGVEGVLMGIGRMASGDLVGGSVAFGTSFMQMIDARMQQALPRMDLQTNLLSRFNAIPEEFRQLMEADWTEQFHPDPTSSNFDKYHNQLENWVRGLETAFLSEEERVRKGSQGIGEAILDGVAEGLNQNNITKTLDLMKGSLDDLLSRMVLEGVMMTEGLKGNIEKLSRTVVEALRDGVIHGSEANAIRNLQSEMDRVAQNVRNPTLETLNLSAPSTSNGSTFGAKASNILALETARTFAAAGI